jgi:hypothetical protein
MSAKGQKRTFTATGFSVMARGRHKVSVACQRPEYRSVFLPHGPTHRPHGLLTSGSASNNGEIS